MNEWLNKQTILEKLKEETDRYVSVTDWDIDKMESYAVKVNEGVVNEWMDQWMNEWMNEWTNRPC